MIRTDSVQPAAAFAPPESAIAAILGDLADPDLSLRDVAEANNTTLDALALFLARPDMAERLEAIESLAARRARLIATLSLDKLAATLARIIEETDAELAHVPVNPKSLPALEQRRRTRETARRAGALLLRIARFSSLRPTIAANASPPAPASPAEPIATTPARRRVLPADPGPAALLQRRAGGTLARTEQEPIRASALNCTPEPGPPHAEHLPRRDNQTRTTGPVTPVVPSPSPPGGPRPHAVGGNLGPCNARDP
jgi:hypothetical protein